MDVRTMMVIVPVAVMLVGENRTAASNRRGDRAKRNRGEQSLFHPAASTKMVGLWFGGVCSDLFGVGDRLVSVLF
jgi:hypothetical protein